MGAGLSEKEPGEAPAAEGGSPSHRPGPEVRKLMRKAQTLAAQGRWRKIIQIAEVSDFAARPEILEVRLRAAIELNDNAEIERCQPLVQALNNPSHRVKLAALLVNAHRPVEAAAILATVAGADRSSKTSNVIRRIRATTKDKTVLVSIDHLVTRRSEERPSEGANKLRYPGDDDDFEVPRAQMSIARPDGISPVVEQYVEDLWRVFARRLAKKPRPYVLEYTDVFINKEGRIWKADAKDLRQTVNGDLETGDAATVPVFQEAFSCLGGNKGYYEWVVDRLAVLSWRAAPDTPDCPVLLRQEHYALALDALGSIGVPQEKVILVESMVFCRKLFVGSSSNVALARKAAYQHTYGRLIKESERIERGSLPRRFYISRRDAPRRAMRNEVDFEHAMIANGIVPVMLSKLNLLQKVSLFHNADLVIGAHGAGLSHLVFGKPGLRVIEMVPAALSELTQMNIRTCFSMLSMAFGLDHTLVMYPATPKATHWTADSALIKSVLDHAGSNDGAVARAAE